MFKNEELIQILRRRKMKKEHENSRREFIKKASLGAGIIGLSAMG